LFIRNVKVHVKTELFQQSYTGMLTFTDCLLVCVLKCLSCCF